MDPKAEIAIPESAPNWREKYFEIERAHSSAVDKIGELTARVMLRERELADRGSDKARAEEKMKEIRAAYDDCSQTRHDLGLKLAMLEAAARAAREALARSHACATLRDDGTCDGCFVSEALAALDAALGEPSQSVSCISTIYDDPSWPQCDKCGAVMVLRATPTDQSGNAHPAATANRARMPRGAMYAAR